MDAEATQPPTTGTPALGREEHTPAPWQVEPGDSGDSSVGIGPSRTAVFHAVSDDAVVEICLLSEPCYRVETDPTNEWDEGLRAAGSLDANARLIAATPDLLAACQGLIEMYVKLGMDTPSMPGFEKTTVEVAREAIAKALGPQRSPLS